MITVDSSLDIGTLDPSLVSSLSHPVTLSCLGKIPLCVSSGSQLDSIAVKRQLFHLNDYVILMSVCSLKASRSSSNIFLGVIRVILRIGEGSDVIASPCFSWSFPVIHRHLSYDEPSENVSLHVVITRVHVHIGVLQQVSEGDSLRISYRPRHDNNRKIRYLSQCLQ